jgi:hypothetical protein
MKIKIWLAVIGVLLALAVAGLVGCGQGSTTTAQVRGSNIDSQQQGIWVYGEGKISAAPDVASLRLGIEAQEASVAVAQTKAAEAMDRVMSVLKSNGVLEKDIQTQYFNINKVTRWDSEKEQEIVIGYRVTNMVTAKIREIGKSGLIIDAVVEAGGDFTRIEGISFTIDDPSTYYKEAREEAMTEAKDKAEQLAKLAGVTLGKPTYISESVSTPFVERFVQYEYAKAVPAAVETAISPGEVEISINVQITYSILN